MMHGRLAVNVSGSYVNGLTQANTANDPFVSVINDPASTLGMSAAAGVSTAINGSPIGVIQTVNTMRWSNLSITWIVPNHVAQFFRSSQVAVALQGSNLGLWTNCRGKDPDVNAYSNGNLTADNGQLPQPRIWRLQLTLR
jgi:hypothetical protein